MLARLGLPHEPEKRSRMIAAKPNEVVADCLTWKQQWRNSFTQLADLLSFLQLDSQQNAGLLDAAASFPLRVPQSFAARMRKGDWRCPLLLQVLPVQLENATHTGFVADPVNDLGHSPTAGVIRKYQSRALLIANGNCAVNCRYCFRREFPYADRGLSASGLAQAVAFVAADPAINEIILSGGDPLALDTAKLARIVAAFAALPQIRRLRIHTRTPIVMPARIDAEFLQWIGALKLPVVMVLHSNHAQEWADTSLVRACDDLRDCRVHLLNQAVLLAGINDQINAQVELSEAMFAAGVLPYYLNQLDPVRGSAHFAVDDQTALRLHQQMQQRLPGFLVPKLVRDVADIGHKAWLTSISA